MADSHGLTEGRRMRVDTTVVETNIDHPTDSSCRGDGVRGADSHHEEDHADRGRGGTQAARPEPQP